MTYHLSTKQYNYRFIADQRRENLTPFHSGFLLVQSYIKRNFKDNIPLVQLPYSFFHHTHKHQKLTKNL